MDAAIFSDETLRLWDVRSDGHQTSSDAVVLGHDEQADTTMRSPCVAVIPPLASRCTRKRRRDGPWTVLRASTSSGTTEGR